MTQANAPFPNFDGITYNPAFFNNTTTSSGGLTQALANTLYLQKLVPDTTTVSDIIDTSTTAATLVIGQTNARQVNAGNPSSLNIVNGGTLFMNNVLVVGTLIALQSVYTQSEDTVASSQSISIGNTNMFSIINRSWLYDNYF